MKLKLLVSQIKFWVFAKFIFVFLTSLFLAWLIFKLSHLSFIPLIISWFQHFSIQFILFLFTLELTFPTLLTSLFRALYEFVLEFSSLFLFFLWRLIMIFQQLVCAFHFQLILLLFVFLPKLMLFRQLLFS